MLSVTLVSTLLFSGAAGHLAQGTSGRLRRDANQPDDDYYDYVDDYYTEEDLQFIRFEPADKDGVYRVVLALDEPGLLPNS